jgi:hypothetical protein
MIKEEFILTSKLDEALSGAEALNPSLKSVRAKLKPVFKGYALSIGTVQSKLRVIDICTEDREVSSRLRRFVYDDYPGDKAYRGQIISRIRKVIKELTGAPAKEVEEGEYTILTREVPEYMRPMLLHLPRNIPKDELLRTAKSEARLQYPLTDRGLRFFSSCIEVHTEYKPATLESLLCEHSAHINRSLEKLFGRVAATDTHPVGVNLRKKLGMQIPEKQTVCLSKELWPHALRAEWETYAEKAITDASDNDDLRWAEDFGFEFNEIKESTLKSREVIMNIALGHIVPYACSIGMTDFGIEELLRIEHGVRLYKTEEVPHDYNPLVEVYRQREKSRSSDRKRSNRDSASFVTFVITLKRIGLYNGKAPLVEAFTNAYRKKRPDYDTKEARKALRLTTYPCWLIDRRIDQLGQEFDKVVKSGAFKRKVDERSPTDADADFNFCGFYVALLIFRFLGYRQQCVRYCKVGDNITFNRDGSITLFWPKDKVKNKKAIKVILDAKKRPYQKRLVSALWLYYREVYPYVRQWSASRGKLGLINNQFFARINLHNDYTCFPERGEGSAGRFYRWWIPLSEKHMKFNELDIEGRLSFNPHFLRTLCINWMKSDLGLSDEEIAEAVGDTVKVVRDAYISKERVIDATPITDKIADRFREREEKELGLKEKLKQEEKKHEEEVIVLKQAAEQAQKRVITLEEEAAALRAARAGDQAIIREQAGLISELATQISQLTASGGVVKQKRVKVA